MTNIAIILFAVAALGGLTLAAMRFRNRPLPMSLALIHGIVAAAGLVLLLVVALGPNGTSIEKTALIIFVVAALGGFYLFSRHVRNRELPIPVVLIHGLVAVAAFATLLYGVFGR
jgi:FtsH-binding integral membrane protein